MEPLAILNADPLDLLFENRNKSYGAYTLRKQYDQRLRQSMAITFTAVAAISFWMYIQLHNHPSVLRPDVGVIVKLEPVQLTDKTAVKPPPVAPKPASVKPPASVQFTTIKIVNETPPATVATVDELNVNAISDKTIAGPPDTGEMHAGPAGESNQPAATAEADAETGPLKIAEIMPEFPGGLEGLRRYLIKNLKMPENSLEEGSVVKVVARFVVGADGKVQNVEIIQPAADAYNKEVRRVVLKMPDWKPGMQNHRNVSVYFNLPVNFVAAD